MGRCFTWAEFQIQCIRLSKDVGHNPIIPCLIERLYFLNKINKPILYTNQNTQGLMILKELQKQTLIMDTYSTLAKIKLVKLINLIQKKLF